MIVTDFTTLQISGSKTASFLNQLCTKPIASQLDDDIYAAFLNKAGRVVFDAYIRPIDHENAWVILPKCMLNIAKTHLNQYAPFSRIKITELQHAWEAITCITPTSTHLPFQLQCTTATEADKASWLREEIKHGIPRIRIGHQERHTAHTLDLHHLNAISFQKGCYLGQEITHRTEMRGNVKKGLYRGKTKHKEALLLTSAHQITANNLYIVDHKLAQNITTLTRLYLPKDKL